MDFFRVPPDHAAVHARLENWGLYLKSHERSRQAPMWRFTRSNARMWFAPHVIDIVDDKDGALIEGVVCKLPTYHRVALKWYYFERCAPARVVRKLGVSYATLYQLVGDARELVMHHLGAKRSTADNTNR